MSFRVPRLEELYALLLDARRGCVEVSESVKRVVFEVLECGDPVLEALAAMLAGELGVVEAAGRLKELAGLESVVELRDPSTGEVRVVSLGAVAGEALAKLRARKVEAGLLELASEEPARVVRAVVVGAGVSVEELASKLRELEGVRVVHVLRFANAVSVEAEALKILEIADLREVGVVREAGVFSVLGGGSGKL